MLRGLTRGLDLSMLDRGHGEHDGQALSFYPRTAGARRRAAEQLAGRALAVGAGDRAEDAARAKPGSAEPWTPFRIVQAFMQAGVPAEAFSYYPSDHAGAGEIVRRTGRSMFFGDVSAVGALGRRSARRAARAGLQQGRDRRRPSPATGGCSTST